MKKRYRPKPSKEALAFNQTFFKKNYKSQPSKWKEDKPFVNPDKHSFDWEGAD